MKKITLLAALFSFLALNLFEASNSIAQIEILSPNIENNIDATNLQDIESSNSDISFSFDEMLSYEIEDAEEYFLTVPFSKSVLRSDFSDPNHENDLLLDKDRQAPPYQPPIST